MTDSLHLTPRTIVAELDKYIVGQAKAKRAVAIAMRNRYRREHGKDEMRGDIIPKNILMIGPTGVGKTEIARRLASLAGAPFVKVEATKYTEVGYVGRDVESMVRDLVEVSVRIVQEERREEVKEAAEHAAIERIIDVLHPETRPPSSQPSSNPFAATLGSIFGGTANQTQTVAAPTTTPASRDQTMHTRETARADIERGFYDVRLVEIETEEAPADFGKVRDLGDVIEIPIIEEVLVKKQVVREVLRVRKSQLTEMGTAAADLRKETVDVVSTSEVSVSLTVGLVFGVYPAWRASSQSSAA